MHMRFPPPKVASRLRKLGFLVNLPTYRNASAHTKEAYHYKIVIQLFRDIIPVMLGHVAGATVNKTYLSEIQCVLKAHKHSR